MTAGMVPLALGVNEGSEQTAPLARAVIGGLAAATLATLVVLPSVFALIQGGARRRSASIDPADSESALYDPELWGRPTDAASPANGAAMEHELAMGHRAEEPPTAKGPELRL